MPSTAKVHAIFGSRSADADGFPRSRSQPEVPYNTDWLRRRAGNFCRSVHTCRALRAASSRAAHLPSVSRVTTKHRAVRHTGSRRRIPPRSLTDTGLTYLSRRVSAASATASAGQLSTVSPVPPVGSSHSPSIDGCNRASRTAAPSDALVVHKPLRKFILEQYPKWLQFR